MFWMNGLGLPVAHPHVAGASTSMPLGCTELVVVQEGALPIEAAGRRGTCALWKRWKEKLVLVGYLL
jgi:hypothetical protein